MTDHTDLLTRLDNLAGCQAYEAANAAEAIKTLIAERDAAFAMSKCECESNEACKNLVALHDEVERLKAEWGEPVAWEWKRTHLAGGYTRQVTISHQEAIEWAADSSNLHEKDAVTPLYARKEKP